MGLEQRGDERDEAVVVDIVQLEGPCEVKLCHTSVLEFSRPPRDGRLDTARNYARSEAESPLKVRGQLTLQLLVELAAAGDAQRTDELPEVDGAVVVLV